MQNIHKAAAWLNGGGSPNRSIKFGHSDCHTVGPLICTNNKNSSSDMIIMIILVKSIACLIWDLLFLIRVLVSLSLTKYMCPTSLVQKGAQGLLAGQDQLFFWHSNRNGRQLIKVTLPPCAVSCKFMKDCCYDV